MDALKNRMKMGVVVRPRDGMQLAEGQIDSLGDVHFVGEVPGLEVQTGDSPEAVRGQLEEAARGFYGSDVVVEVPNVHLVRSVSC